MQAAKRRQAAGIALTLLALAIATHYLYRAVHREAVNFRTGEQAFARGDYAAAADAYADAREAGFISYTLDHHEALALIRTDRPSEAIELLRLRLLHHPDETDTRDLALGTALGLGRTRTAISLFAALGPRDRLPLADLVRLADLSQQAGQLDEAIACVQLALQRAPRSADLHTLAGQYLSYAGRRGEAIAAFTTALELAPTHRAARLALARNLAWEQRFAESVNAYRNYLGE